MMHSRFDYVKYDGQAQSLQMSIKAQLERVELMLNDLPPSREKSLAVTKLEESFMWIGKAIRDNQISRTPMTQQNEDRG